VWQQTVELPVATPASAPAAEQTTEQG
jgi:hypothetical protein